MNLSPVSLLALAVIIAAIAVGWARKFLAVGALVVGNLLIFIMSEFGPKAASCDFGDGMTEHSVSLIKCELGLHSWNLVHASGMAMGALQLVSAMFVHENLSHLFGNMIVLLAFALPFEERIGHRPFIAVYLGAGLVGSLAELSVTHGMAGGMPPLMYGASGAVFGIIGAFGASFPNVIVPLPLPLFVIMFFVRMRVWIAATAFAALEYVVLAIQPLSDHTAHFAHLGGLAAGIVLGFGIRRARPQRGPVPVDLKLLGQFAHDPATNGALQQMQQNHDEPQIFQAWLDRFFRTAKCPTCQGAVMPHHQGEVVCRHGHRFDVRSQKVKAAGKA